MVQPALALDDSPPTRIETQEDVSLWLLRATDGNPPPPHVWPKCQQCGADLKGYRKHAKYCRGSRCRVQASRDRKAARQEAEAEANELARFMTAASILGAVDTADLVELLRMQPWELRTAIHQIVEVRP